MSQTVIVLGQGSSSYLSIELLEKKYPEFKILHCSYAPKSNNSKQKYYLQVSTGEEISTINKALDGSTVVAIVNRYDSYIPLHGLLVDHFKVNGPASEALSHFRYKVKTDALLRKSGLNAFRPKALTVTLDSVKESVDEIGFPCVLKPSVGAKSRGVYVLKNKDDLKQAIQNLEAHHSKVKIARMLENDEVLVEEYIDGKQIAPISYIDDTGVVHIVAGVDVARGPDVGQKHIQNVYRTTPSHMNEQMLFRVRWLLQQLADKTKLKNTFLDPELYLLEDGRIILIEINARLGGFRNRLAKEAFGIDLDKAVIDLALGKKPDLVFRKVESCTAAEIWEDKSGKIEAFELPKGYEYIELKQPYKIDDDYIAPPEKDKPIASFYLHDKSDSKNKALEMRRKVKLSIE